MGLNNPSDVYGPLSIEMIRRLRAQREAFVLEAHGPGRIEMRHCIMCGHLEWQCTNRNETTTVVYHETPANNCERCVEIQHRYPELMRWMLGIVMHMHEVRLDDHDNRGPMAS